MEESIYIKVLEFAEEKGVEGINYDIFEKEFGKDKSSIYLSALKTSAFTHKEGNETYTSTYILSFDGYFKLHEHRELLHARESSTNATLFASAALFISILKLGFSIYSSNKQIETPIMINPTQMKELIIENQSNQKYTPLCCSEGYFNFKYSFDLKDL